jgi:hypothetical protein
MRRHPSRASLRVPCRGGAGKMRRTSKVPAPFRGLPSQPGRSSRDRRRAIAIAGRALILPSRHDSAKTLNHSS